MPFILIKIWNKFERSKLRLSLILRVRRLWYVLTRFSWWFKISNKRGEWQIRKLNHCL